MNTKQKETKESSSSPKEREKLKQRLQSLFKEQELKATETHKKTNFQKKCNSTGTLRQQVVVNNLQKNNNQQKQLNNEKQKLKSENKPLEQLNNNNNILNGVQERKIPSEIQRTADNRNNSGKHAEKNVKMKEKKKKKLDSNHHVPDKINSQTNKSLKKQRKKSKQKNEREELPPKVESSQSLLNKSSTHNSHKETVNENQKNKSKKRAAAVSEPIASTKKVKLSQPELKRKKTKQGKKQKQALKKSNSKKVNNTVIDLESMPGLVNGGDFENDNFEDNEYWNRSFPSDFDSYNQCASEIEDFYNPLDELGDDPYDYSDLDVEEVAEYSDTDEGDGDDDDDDDDLSYSSSASVFSLSDASDFDLRDVDIEHLYNSADEQCDEDYRLPEHVAEDMIIHAGTATKRDLLPEDNVQFKDKKYAQIVELKTEKSNIEVIRQPKEYQREELLKLPFKLNPSTDNLAEVKPVKPVKPNEDNLSCNDVKENVDDCPKLVPIIDEDGFQLYNGSQSEEEENDDVHSLGSEYQSEDDDDDDMESLGSEYLEIDSDDAESLFSEDINVKYLNRDYNEDSSSIGGAIEKTLMTANRSVDVIDCTNCAYDCDKTVQKDDDESLARDKTFIQRLYKFVKVGSGADIFTTEVMDNRYLIERESKADESLNTFDKIDASIGDAMIAETTSNENLKDLILKASSNQNNIFSEGKSSSLPVLQACQDVWKQTQLSAKPPAIVGTTSNKNQKPKNQKDVILKESSHQDMLSEGKTSSLPVLQVSQDDASKQTQSSVNLLKDTAIVETISNGNLKELIPKERSHQKNILSEGKSSSLPVLQVPQDEVSKQIQASANRIEDTAIVEKTSNENLEDLILNDDDMISEGKTSSLPVLQACEDIGKQTKPSANRLKNTAPQSLNDYRTFFCNAINANLVLVLLKDPFYIYGTVRLTLLAGTVDVYGHSLIQNKEVELFSPRGCSEIEISPKSCSTTKDLLTPEKLKDILKKYESNFLKIDLEQLTRSFDAEKDAIVILKRNDERRKLVQQFKKFMNENVFPNLQNITMDRCLYDSEYLLRCMINTSATDHQTLRLPVQWQSFALEYNSRVMLVGGKGVGKSTLLRYLVNKHITRYGKILLIDLDIGQPELFVPQTVSCATLEKPLLGPGFFLNTQPDTAFVVGNTNIVLCPHKYESAVRSLIAYCREQANYKNIPWLINTMGYNKGFGPELISVIAQQLPLTDVIQIQSNKAINNFYSLLYPEVVAKMPRHMFVEEGVAVSSQNSNQDLKYRLHIWPSAVVQESRYQKEWGMSPKDMRYANMIARLSDALQGHAEWLSDCIPVSAHLDQMKLVNLVDNIPAYSAEELTKAMEANLVYLCFHQDDITPLECLGIGVVRAVDFHIQQLYLVPALHAGSSKLFRVNCLALGEVPLPNSLLTNQGSRVHNTAPFVYNTIEANASKAIKQIYHRPMKFLKVKHKPFD